MRALVFSLALVFVGLYADSEARAGSGSLTPGVRRLAVAWNDSTAGTGKLQAIRSQAPFEFSGDAIDIGMNSRLRRFDGRIYAVSRRDKTVTVVDAATWTVDVVHSLGEGGDPFDIAVVNSQTAFITRAGTARLQKLNLSSGALTDSVNFSAFADPDGDPDLGTMTLYEGRLFVQIRRINFEFPGIFAAPAYLAVVDLASETLIDVDPVADGDQAIELLGTFPDRKMHLVPETRKLYLNAAGTSFDAGGLEAIDLDTLMTEGLVIAERSGRVGAELGPVVFVTPDRGFLAFTTDLILSSHLVAFSFSGGVEEGQLHVTVDYLAPELAFDPLANVIYFPNSGSAGNGVYVFDADDGRAVTERIIPTSGQPTDILLLDDISERFTRGDVDGTGFIDIADGINVLIFVFLGGTTLGCLDAADANDTGSINVADASYLLNLLFRRGPAPVEPIGSCGTDPTIDLIGCEAFTPCESR